MSLIDGLNEVLYEPIPWVDSRRKGSYKLPRGRRIVDEKDRRTSVTRGDMSNALFH